MNKAFLLKIIIVLTISSCYERQEGCIDPFAANYTVTVDDSCSDCCTYPTVPFNVSYHYDTLSLNRDSFYTLDNGLYFKVVDFYLTFHEFDIKGVLSNYQFKSKSTYDGVDSDLKISTLFSKTFNLGEIRIQDTLKMISWNLGIPDELDALNINSTNPTIELLNDSLYYDTSEYYSAGIHIISDSISLDTVKLGIKKSQIEMLTLDFKIDDLFIDKGDPLGIIMHLDFLKMMENINEEDLNSINPAENKFGINISKAISVQY